MTHNVYTFRKPTSSRKRLIIWVLLIIGLAFTLYTIRQTPTGIYVPGIAQSEPKEVPDIAFQHQDGSIKKLSDYSGKLVLVHFWATWCGPCVYELPLIDRLQKEMGPEGLEVLALSLDKDRSVDQLKEFYRQYRIEDLRVYQDPYGAFRELGRTRAVPTTIFIDREGREVARVQGAFDWGKPSLEKLLRHYMKTPEIGTE